LYTHKKQIKDDTLRRKKKRKREESAQRRGISVEEEAKPSRSERRGVEKEWISAEGWGGQEERAQERRCAAKTAGIKGGEV